MNFGINFVFLLLIGFVVEAANAREALDDKYARLLQNSRTCGERIGVYTTDDVLGLGRLMLEPYFPAGTEDFANAVGVAFNSARYKVAAFKLCASCSDIDQWYASLEKFMPTYHTQTYCNFDSATYNIPASFLVLVPVDDNEDILKGVNLRAYLSLRPTRAALETAPTVAFPANMTTFVQDATARSTSLDIRNFIVDMLPAMVAAAAGSVSIIPDYLGYGESVATANRTVFHPPSYELAGITAYFGTEKWLQEITQFCTYLDTFKVTVQGLEDGANAALYVSQLLQTHEWTRTPRGVRSTQVFATGVLDVETFWAKTASVLNASTASQEELERRHELLLMSLYTFSGRLSVIPDSPAGMRITDSAVSATYESQILDRFNYPPNTAISLPISDATAMFNSLLLQFISNIDKLNNTTPCAELLNSTSTTTSNFVAICESIRNSSGWNPLEENLGPFWIHPLAPCYGDNDKIISTDQWAGPGVENVKSKEDGRLYRRYIGPQESDDLQIDVAANHFQVNELCLVHPLLFYNLQAYAPTDSADKPNLITPITSDQYGQCQDPSVEVVTNPPTKCDDQGNCETVEDSDTNNQGDNGNSGVNGDSGNAGDGDGDGTMDGNGDNGGDGDNNGDGNSDGDNDDKDGGSGGGSAAMATVVNFPASIVGVLIFVFFNPFV